MPCTPKIFVGTRIRLDGKTHAVAGFDGPSVILRSQDGRELRMTTSALVDSNDFAVLDGNEERESTSPSFPDLLNPEQRREAEEKLAHLNEALTGFRSGNAEDPTRGEPRREYDPQLATQRERMESKARELGITARTLWKRQKAYQRSGIAGLPDARRMRLSTPLGRLDPRIHKAILEVLEDLTDRSTVTQERIRRMVQRNLDAEHGDGEVECPPRSTFNRALREIGHGSETFGSAKNRRNAARRPEPPYGKFKPTRPGEYVQIDSTPLDVHALDHVSYRWMPLQLTIALDLYTRSIIAWRFTPRDVNRVDAAMILYDALTPTPMPPGWPEEARFARRYTGIPENVVVDIGAEDAAGVPVMNPENVVVDRGRVFLSQAFKDACARLGISIQLSRPYRPTDKAAIERVFGTIRTRFLENLPGYKGPDLYSRGEDVESDAFLFTDEIQEFFAEWVATYWQVRHHQGIGLSPQPGLRLSPNETYDEGIARAGFVYAPPARSIYYDLLPTEWRTIQDYGVDVRGLRYDGDALNPYRRTTSPYGGPHKGRWPIRYDPRDLSYVFFLEPATGEWHPLRWVGATEVDQPFSEATVSYAKSLVKERGGNTKNHDALAPVLNALVARIENKEIHGKEERRLAARHALQVEQSRRDQGKGSVARLPEIKAPDEPAEMFDLDPDSIPIMPSVDGMAEEMDEAEVRLEEAEGAPGDDLENVVEIFDDVYDDERD